MTVYAVAEATHVPFLKVALGDNFHLGRGVRKGLLYAFPQKNVKCHFQKLITVTNEAPVLHQ